MHIGFYCRGWPVNEYPNGIVTYVHNLRRELLNQGHRVSVFASEIGSLNRDPGIYLVRPLRTRRFSRQKLTQLFRKDRRVVFEWGKAIAATVREVHERDPMDVFEMEESFGWCADVQMRVPVPVVVKLHGPEFLTRIALYGQSEIAPARIDMEGRGLRQVGAIVSPSMSTLQRTVSYYDLHPDVQRVIPNPVVADPDIELWNLDTCERKTLLFVGQFSKVKGGDTMLIAFKRLVETDRDMKLIFVGPDRGIATGERRTVSFHQFKDSLFADAQRENIAYLGQLPRAEVSHLRTKAMLNIVVSRWENQPNTALEAMAQGCPVVAFDTGGINEIIHHEITGLLARDNDIDHLCEQITRLVKDPAGAKRMGEAARRFVTDRHSVQKVANAAVELYCQAISMANAGGKQSI